MAKFRRYALVRARSELTLAQRESDLPTLAPDQVLIRIKAASLNYRDLLTIGDVQGNKDGLIPLSDGAGEIHAVGSEVQRWAAGDRVSTAFFPTWHSGAFSPAHLAVALGGGQTDGVLSEFVVAHQHAIIAIPEHLTFAQAATLPCAGVTAWQALFARGQIEAGETVLVQGTGGVALIAMQLAHAAGARVIVISSSDEKLAKAKELGAWQGINYRTTPEWDRSVIELTQGVGVNHILELGGPSTYDRSIAAIAPGGQIAQIGVLSGFGSQPNMTPLQFKNASVNGICVGSVEHFKALSRFLEQHRIEPIIDRHFGFSEVPLAYDYLRTAGHFGKVCITLN